MFKFFSFNSCIFSMIFLYEVKKVYDIVLEKLWEVNDE